MDHSYKTETLHYQDGEQKCIGKLVYPIHGNTAPVVMIAPDWSGCNDFAVTAANRLAKQGYIAFAIDPYGDGRIGKNVDEKMALMGPLKEDRQALQNRLLAALSAAKNIESSKGPRAMIGFCFGGLCALDLARSGADISAAVSFHGLLDSNGLTPQEITTDILVLHGYDDPMAPPAALAELMAEFKATTGQVEVISYNKTLHAFTNPAANDPSFGTVYSDKISQRAWQRTLHFLEESLAAS